MLVNPQTFVMSPAHIDVLRWQFTISDNNGTAFTGVTRRRPNASDSRTIQASDPYCIFPGCTIASQKCDLDHRILYSKGGKTDPQAFPVSD